jgi:hypothetical protein
MLTSVQVIISKSFTVRIHPNICAEDRPDPMSGISPANGLPFSPPVEFRIRQNNKAQKHQKRTYEEGLCHNCKGWVALEGPNIGDSKASPCFLQRFL